MRYTVDGGRGDTHARARTHRNTERRIVGKGGMPGREFAREGTQENKGAFKQGEQGKKKRRNKTAGASFYLYFCECA
jgi:hypothetical protein